MKKINEIAKYVYFAYLGLYFIYVILMGILAGSFYFNLFIFSSAGIIGMILALLWFLIYNGFLFWFVYLYSAEHKYPGWIWLCLCLFLPHYVGLVAFIALIRYVTQSKKFIAYLTTPDVNKEDESK